MEQELLQSMLDTSVMKQTALVANNRDKLDECTRKEEALLPQIKSAETARLHEFVDIRSKFNITITSNKLDEFIECLEDEISEEEIIKLTELQLNIKSIVSDLSKLNQQNMYLINHSRKFLNDTINTIINKSEKSIIDRKV